MKQLGVSFGSIFLLFSHESSGGSTFIAAGGNPWPRLLMTALKIHYTRLLGLQNVIDRPEDDILFARL